ncbi:hypothetical protein CBR_g8737 [Chara braunii]|uniref:HAT C-terminal dimerisation domain-containing protein n=1 Tax=Chara braunii TaxID=69332 RepID=A0A388KMQ9_CHABU|nr:hypothetical protein CBR_g8737 [Chara braunii]|eukprot:GBG71315.1 hypothetical protein CBR_g8737 [Chara braunii]
MTASERWNRHGASHKKLRDIAMRVTAMWSTATPCERNWSSLDLVHDKRRGPLSPDSLAKLVYIHWNLQLLDIKKKKSTGSLAGYLDMWAAFFDEVEPPTPNDPAVLPRAATTADLSDDEVARRANLTKIPRARLMKPHVVDGSSSTDNSDDGEDLIWRGKGKNKKVVVDDGEGKAQMDGKGKAHIDVDDEEEDIDESEEDPENFTLRSPRASDISSDDNELDDDLTRNMERGYIDSDLEFLRPRGMDFNACVELDKDLDDDAERARAQSLAHRDCAIVEQWIREEAAKRSAVPPPMRMNYTTAEMGGCLPAEGVQQQRHAEGMQREQQEEDVQQHQQREQGLQEQRQEEGLQQQDDRQQQREEGLQQQQVQQQDDRQQQQQQEQHDGQHEQHKDGAQEQQQQTKQDAPQQHQQHKDGAQQQQQTKEDGTQQHQQQEHDGPHKQLEHDPLQQQQKENGSATGVARVYSRRPPVPSAAAVRGVVQTLPFPAQVEGVQHDNLDVSLAGRKKKVQPDTGPKVARGRPQKYPLQPAPSACAPVREDGGEGGEVEQHVIGGGKVQGGPALTVDGVETHPLKRPKRKAARKARVVEDDPTDAEESSNGSEEDDRESDWE